MTRETLVLLLVYYALTTVIGGLLMAWRFTTLRRDSMNGAFTGFGAALIGFGLPGLAVAWAFFKPRKLGIADDPEGDGLSKVAFRFSSNVLWGMGAFGFTWILLIILALNTSPNRFLVVLAGGLYEGMLVFLVAAGLSIIFGLMDVLNFAQGALFMIGAYVAVVLFPDLRSAVGLYPAFLIALGLAGAVGALLGFGMEVTLIRTTYSRPVFQMVLTFGVALFLTELVIAQYGTEGIASMNLRASDGSHSLITGLVSGTSIQSYWVLMIVIGFIMMIGVQYLLQNTRIGIIIRAGVQDSEMVEALGIDVRLIFTAVFALGTMLAALGGAVASGFLAPTPVIGDVFLLQAIAVVIVGGLGSYSGTSVAAIVIGITEAVISHFALVNYNSQALGGTAVLLLLIIVLYVKPTGLFGTSH